LIVAWTTCAGTIVCIAFWLQYGVALPA